MKPATGLDGIDNPAAFVQDALRRSRINVPDAESRDELVAEGLLLLCELRRSYDPARDQDPDPRTGGFVGYAHYLLPRKLIAAWHRSRPEHRYATDPDTGKRRWVIGPRPVSLDHHLTAPDGTVRDDVTLTSATHPAAWAAPRS